jgi:hypothetical protein
MNNIAFVYTEFQQEILASICLQNKIKIDFLFVRKSIRINQILKLFYVKKVFLFEGLDYNSKNIFNFFLEYKKAIKPNIDNLKHYNLYTWSINNPIILSFIKSNNIRNINIFEDGTGSYIPRRYTLKEKLLQLITNTIISFSSYNFLKKKHFIIGWSLYKDCHPLISLNKKVIINKEKFKTIIKQDISNHKISTIKNNSSVIITSPFVEFNVINEDEYFESFSEMILKIHRLTQNTIFYIKPHPRNNILFLNKMISKVTNNNNLKFTILDNSTNIELLAVYNENLNIDYFSIGSSALYVIKALQLKNASTYLIKNDILPKSFNKLYTFYKNIGIYEK